ncbi:MAG: hypothetical protein WCC64_16820 [Aliidongia sp.]
MEQQISLDAALDNAAWCAPYLKLRRVPIDTYREPVVYLPRGACIYRSADFQALSKVEADGRHLIAVLNVIDHDGWLLPDEVGVSALGFTLLGLPEGAPVGVVQAAPAKSLEAVRRKVEGEALSADDFDAIIGEIAEMRYSKTEITAFLISSASFLTTNEVVHLTRAMARAGRCLEWPSEKIVVPIVAAHGLSIPKTSSRAITSPTGTADTMEVLAKVDPDIQEMRNVVEAGEALFRTHAWLPVDFRFALALAAALGYSCHSIDRHSFPDGQSLVWVVPPAAAAIVYCRLDRPNDKVIELLLAADALTQVLAWALERTSS